MNIIKNVLSLFIILLFYREQLCSAIVRYNFDITTKKINLTGKQVMACTINNQIPGPTIEATVGDTLQVTFNNKMNEETSIHWHGVLLPNDQDGVPYLTTPPILPQSSFTYQFNITHHGTYWYHSHSGLQEQQGMYGALVFHPKQKETTIFDREEVVVLSDWTNEAPKQVLANLKRDGDYYALKKGTVQSWVKVLSNGLPAIKNRIRNALSRMGPMDISDVGYDSFLARGSTISYISTRPEETIKIRLINASTSSYFNVEYAAKPLTIIAADGVDIEPIKVKRLRIAIAETYDLIIKAPQNKSAELRATAEDGTGYSSIFIGNGDKLFAPNIAQPNLFLIDHNMHYFDKTPHFSMNHSKHNVHHEETTTKHSIKKPSLIQHMTDYKHLRATQDTHFSKKKNHRIITLKLTGNMDQYLWSFNNTTLLESDKIMIRKGEVIRLTLDNQTMMHHPIHLHGHFFRVLNGQGNRSPLKHTVNVPSMKKITIEFYANKEKDWFFHCHNLYHMATGMARIISYTNTTTATKKIFQSLVHDNWYSLCNMAALSNMTLGYLRAFNTRNTIEIEYDWNYKNEYEYEAIYLRNINRFLNLYVGINAERVKNNPKSKVSAIFGARYLLPLLLVADIRLDTKGHWRAEFESNMQLTNRTNFLWSYNTDKEYRFTLLYEINKNIFLIGTYDSDFKWGGGMQVTF
jgi:FtsP/CotA-like multicopper oxidase with cupredoxin domain